MSKKGKPWEKLTPRQRLVRGLGFGICTPWPMMHGRTWSFPRNSGQIGSMPSAADGVRVKSISIMALLLAAYEEGPRTVGRRIAWTPACFGGCSIGSNALATSPIKKK